MFVIRTVSLFDHFDTSSGEQRENRISGMKNQFDIAEFS